MNCKGCGGFIDDSGCCYCNRPAPRPPREAVSNKQPGTAMIPSAREAAERLLIDHAGDYVGSVAIERALRSFGAACVREAARVAHENLASQAKGLWNAGNINDSDVLTNAMAETVARIGAIADRLERV